MIRSVRRALAAARFVLLASALPLFAQAPAETAAAPRLDEQPLDLSRVQQVVGPPRGARLSGEAQEEEAKRVGSLLRCPVCQGLSVSDSPSTMATNMRQQVRELVGAGFAEDQILSYYEASYGEFVRLQPPLRGVNWLVWLAPLVGLGAGAAIVFLALRRQPGALPAVPAGAPLAGPAGDRAAQVPPHESAAPAVAAASSASGAEAPPASASSGVDPLPDDPELARLVLRVREIAYGWPAGVRPAKG
ncbi:MAG: cytochrome c-type biogenesis protein CcmH [Vicinamibacteria bacterium]